MVMKTFTAILAILCIMLAPQQIWSQTNGRIQGKIIDSSSRQPLTGATVLIEGTGMGAVTDLEGDYEIHNVPQGSYNVAVTYIGYQKVSFHVQVKKGENLVKDIMLEPVGLVGETVLVTAQASGQKQAINQQLSAERIVNVVSADRIQELPDANAAESLGRLPGISLVRNGGEGAQVVIRGLAPKYNQIMIDGVEMASTSSSDRGSDLSMISSNMLNGIEVSKTVTPDMDGAALGGVVNFKIKEAKSSQEGKPQVSLLTQGGYKNLQREFGNYKFEGSVEDRFFDEKFGVFAQGLVERVNLTSDQLGGSYSMKTFNYGVDNPLQLNSLNLAFNPRDRQRYDGTVVMDYKYTDGKIRLMNFLSRSDTKTENRSQNYNLAGNSISYGAGSSQNQMNVITNLLDIKKNIYSINADVKLSHSYTENISPDSWSMDFLQASAGMNTIPRGENPLLIAKAGSLKTNLDDMFFNGISTNNSFSKQRNLSGSVDLERNFNITDLITSTLKMGGMYLHVSRFYDYEEGTGGIYFPGTTDARKAVFDAFPWMTQAPYALNPNGSSQIPIGVFLDPKFSYGNFLKGNYAMGTGTDLGLIRRAIDVIKSFQRDKPATVSNAYQPLTYDSHANDYTGDEYKNAGYIMATVNVGPVLQLIAGVRYQGLKTSYTAARYDNAAAPNPYPYPLPHQDTTISEYHGYWLPNVSLRYRPTTWLDARFAYTNTITYPDFSGIVPRIDIFNNSVTWNNFQLQPGFSRNFDAQVSVYDNTIGLLTVGGYLKKIDNLIFSAGGRYITDPSQYPGLPSWTKNYQISTSINNPYRVDVWGAEVEWQTHFWYLPQPLSGLVMNVNYTHIFSGAKYPYTLTKPGTLATKWLPSHVDTFYTDRLINQPNDIVNLALGYDYKGFSTRVSMIYQSQVFSGTNFWPEMRASKDKYLRWDFSVKQTLPWYGMEAFFNLNNLNSESDVNFIRGSGFPNSESDYGMTADLGLRWRL